MLDVIEIEQKNGLSQDEETIKAEKRQSLDIKVAQIKNSATDLEYLFGSSFCGMNLSLLLILDIVECINKSSSIDDLKQSVTPIISALEPLKELKENYPINGVLNDVLEKNHSLKSN